MARRFDFKVKGMDCAEEITVIRRALQPYIKDENSLAFDILNGKLSVELEDINIKEVDLIKAINKTGMKASTWQAAKEQANQKETIWQHHEQAFMVTVCTVFLILGFLIHSYMHGFFDALTSGEGSQLIFPRLSITFYLIAIITGGWFIFPKAIYALKGLRPDMNLLMTIAVIGAAVIGQWFEAATVTFLFALSLLLESWSVGRARHAIQSLMALTPLTARYRYSIDGEVVEKPVEQVPVGAIVLVRPGEKIPMEGRITKGTTSVNQAPITGESIPVEKTIGDEVYAATVNGEGAIEFKVTKAAQDSTLAHIIHLVEKAQSRRAKSEQWVETFARYYTPLMLLFAILIAIIPPLIFQADWLSSIYEGLVILVIACPCALVVSTPVSIVAGLSAAASTGVLIKGGIYLEEPGRLKAIAIDKTGTVTTGIPEVQNIIPLDQYDEKQLLKIASSLEVNSQHPLAQAICQRAQIEKIEVTPAENFKAISGKGAEGTINGQPFWIGSHRLLHEKALNKEDKRVHQQAIDLENAGHSVVIIGNDERICGLISVIDTVRPNASIAIRNLKNLGIKNIMMLTGDNEGTAQAIAKASSIDHFKAELLPEDKVNQVAALVKQHQHVAMVGDGINDAPALAMASLGIAMGAVGSDAAIETADVALMSDDLSKLPWLVKHSRRTVAIIKQNIVFSLSVKALFIVLALLGLATLWMAIAADTGAALVVIFNGLRLLKV